MVEETYSMEKTMQSLRLPDGRALEFTAQGPEDGPVVLFHHGMPGSAVPVASVLDSVTDRGYRVVTYSRAGYGTSTSRPGRTIADTSEDCRVLMDHLGIQRYLVVGWSMGGPHALATAATDPGRVTGVLLVASFAPYDADGLEYVAGMGLQNTVLFQSVSQGDQALRAAVSHMSAAVQESSSTDLSETVASLLPDVDVAALSTAYGAENAVNMAHGLVAGDDGWFDDLRALTTPWGFDPADITAPLDLWHGALDRMVPITHGGWLAEHLPTAHTHFEDDHGHLSIGVGSLGDKLDLLVRRAS